MPWPEIFRQRTCEVTIAFIFLNWMSIDGDQGYPCEWFLSPVRFIWETNKQTKLNFNFQVVISCREILGQGWCMFQHLSVLGPYLGQTHAGLCSCCHCECELICSSLVLCLEGLDSLLSFIPSVSYTLLLSLTEFFETRGEASGRDNIQDWVFHSLSFFFLHIFWLWVSVPISCRRKLL